MSDQAIMREAAELHKIGEPISDIDARVIANAWHGGQASALYSLASTGAIDKERAMLEVEACALHASLSDWWALDALHAYIARWGERSPQDGWTNLSW